MRGLTHASVAFAIAATVYKFGNFSNLAALVIASVLASLVPDLDHPKSLLAEIVPVAKLTRWVCKILYPGQRTSRVAFHSLVAMLAFIALCLDIVAYVALSFGFNVVTEVVAGLIIGYGSHLVLDALTVSGVAPLTPFSDVRFRWFIRTGGLFDKVLGAVAFLAGVAILVAPLP